MSTTQGGDRFRRNELTTSRAGIVDRVPERLLASIEQLTRRLEAATRPCVAVSSRSRRTHGEHGDRAVAMGVTPDVPDPTAKEPLSGLQLTEEETVVLAKVADILRKVRFGTVVLVVQDGKVVQIEIAEKFRLR
jgi:hypothetical protein